MNQLISLVFLTMSNLPQSLQLIFCVETISNANTDVIYLNCIIEHYLPNLKTNQNVKISFICLEGKFKYNQKKIITQIDSLKKEFRLFSNGITEIVYVFDKDKFTSDPRDAFFNEEVTTFCTNKKYELVWFVKDIEHVLLGKQINNNDKKKSAIEFKKNNGIHNIDARCLDNANPCKDQTSNCLCILSKIIRKYNLI